MHTIQREEMFVEEIGICFFVSLCCDFDANNCEAVLVLVIEVLLFSGFALIRLCFIRSRASVLFKPFVKIKEGRFNPVLFNRKEWPRPFHV